MTRFECGAVAVEIAADPLRPGRRVSRLPQVREADSTGSTYAYGRARKERRHSLVFPRLSAAELAALLAFFEVTVKGVRHPFLWISEITVQSPYVVAPFVEEGYVRNDYPERSEYLVRFNGSSLPHREIAPGQHRAEVELQEEL